VRYHEGLPTLPAQRASTIWQITFTQLIMASIENADVRDQIGIMTAMTPPVEGVVGPELPL